MTFQDFLTESINDKGIFKALFLAGIPASGKSSIQKKLNTIVRPKVVNTDKFTREYFGVKGVYDVYQDVPDDVVIRSSELTQKQLTMYIDSMLPLVIDSTSSNPSNLIKRNGILEGVGYDTGMVFVYTDLETAKRRNAKRIKQGKGGVSEEFLAETHEKIVKMMTYYKEHFKFFKVINNNFDNASDIDLNDILKSIYTFYLSEIKNPIGQNVIEYLKANNKKYLSEYNDNLLKHLSGWYA